MFKLDLNRVRTNVAKATTADLLERVTVAREGMEPAALDIIETELRRRGVSFQEQAAFGEAQEKVLLRATSGFPLRCCKCLQTAVFQQMGWHRLFGILPLFPRLLAYCEQHAPQNWRKALSPPRATGLK